MLDYGAAVATISSELEQLTCSPTAQPPHQRTILNDQRFPRGAYMNRYCAPPRRKQCVVYCLLSPAPVENSVRRFIIVSYDIGRFGWIAPFGATYGMMKPSSWSGRPNSA